MQIETLSIENFKSLKKIKLSPKQITILIGPNSSGKSSILQILAIMKQSAGNRGSGSFSPNGDVLNLGSFEDILTDHDKNEELSIDIDANTVPDKKFNQVYGKGKTQFHYGVSILEGRAVRQDFRLEHNLLQINYTSMDETIKKLSVFFKQGQTKVQPTDLSSILPRIHMTEYPGDSDLEYRTFENYFSSSTFLRAQFDQFHYIPSSRLVDDYSLPFTHTDQTNILRSDSGVKMTAKIISYLSSKPSAARQVSNWTKMLFGKTIQPRTVPNYIDNTPSTNVTIDFLKNNIERAIMNEGSGANQVILLLTMLSIIEKNSIIGIEEPEIHLHPKAQSDLAKILIDVSQKNNQQIIFTTHSEHMLYPILTSIVSKQKNSLTKEQVGIYYFDIDENDRTHCEELKIDDYGRIKGGLKGFFEENVNSLTEYLDALKFSEKAKK